MKTLGFVALAWAAIGCSGPAQSIARSDTPTHLGDAWFTFRAEALGLTESGARTRDQALSEEEPPEDETLDAGVGLEAAALWRSLCATCHGQNGDLEGAVELPGERPRKWGSFGVSMGFFFGGDGMRAGIYRKIRDGVAQEDGTPTPMRAFGGELAREQIWGLVRHIEGF